MNILAFENKNNGIAISVVMLKVKANDLFLDFSDAIKIICGHQQRQWSLFKKFFILLPVWLSYSVTLVSGVTLKQYSNSTILHMTQCPSR